MYSGTLFGQKEDGVKRCFEIREAVKIDDDDDDDDDQGTVQPKNNARARSGAKSFCSARTRKKQIACFFAVYPQEHAKRKKLKFHPQEAARSYEPKPQEPARSYLRLRLLRLLRLCR